jgi:hypothetical protein
VIGVLVASDQLEHRELHMAKVDYSGRKFGRLTAIKKVISGKRGCYLCVCECGNETTVRGDSLTSGKTRSCGCLPKDVNVHVHSTHGDSKSRIYKIYKKMISRCYNKNNDRYHMYGDRGIKVCAEWLDRYETFKEWSIKNNYSDNLTIDRIDNDGDYAPDNCRWTTNIIQSNNTSRNIYVEYKGETKTLAQWCRELDYPYASTRALLAKGDKTIEEIFSREHIGKGFDGTR